MILKNLQICFFSILKQLDQVRYQIGYCPQYDALHNRMTAREELRFYARVRGIKSALIEHVSLLAFFVVGEKRVCFLGD